MNITIQPFTNPSGAEVFRVSGIIGSERRRKNFKTEADALTAKQNWEREAMNLAPLPAITTRLTEAEAREAELCFARLVGRELTLTTALDYALKNYTPSQKQCKVAAAIAEFLAKKNLENLRPRTLDNLKHRLAALKNGHGDRMVSDIQSAQIEQLTAGGSARTQINRRLVLANFFNWCVRQKYCAASPVRDAQAPRVRGRKLVETLNVGQCRAILRAAQSHQDGATVPYFVACLFGGVRPAEAARLTWDKVHLRANPRLDIDADVAKTGETRYVTLTRNAVKWLTPHKLRQTAFAITRYAFDAVREKARLAAWPGDAMRHTAVSMYLAHFKDSGEAVERHGHSVQVMLKHYRNRVLPEDAAEFWTLAPGTCPPLPVEQPERKAA